MFVPLKKNPNLRSIVEIHVRSVIEKYDKGKVMV